MVGWRKRQEATADLEEDRRLWVRYPCELETTYQPSQGGEAERFSAIVRNVSLGGIKLRVDRPLDVGSLLSVELPAPSEESTSTVLAYVVRLSEKGPAEWELGCSFATVLSQEDLESFGAKQCKADPYDRRTWDRFPCAVEATYQFVRGQDEQPQGARVVDISANGIAFVVSQSLEVGKLLNLQLHGGRTDLTILGSIVRVTGPIDHEWTIACNFIRELAEAELHGLLSAAETAVMA